MQIEALLRGYFNAWASYGLMLSDAVFFDATPDLRGDQYPGLKPFFRQQPERSTKFRSQFHDMLREATETRRTMRQMDRAFRLDIGDELANSPANLKFSQLSRANKIVRAFGNEIRIVQQTRALADLQGYAARLGREREFRADIGKMRASEDWSNIGGLKLRLLDMWIGRGNEVFKDVVTDVEGQRTGCAVAA